MNDVLAMANAILPFILMAAIFYFMLWRPQKKEQQRRQRMLASLKKGDKIITMGGMYGVLTAVGDNKVTVKLAENVEVEFTRASVSGYQDPEKQARAERGEL